MLKWLDEARSLIGIKELPGLASNPKILHWGSRLGVRVLGIPYTSDATAWCGLYCAWCVHQAGLAPPKIAIRAKAWASWGIDAGMTATRPPHGAVAVFERQGGGHVGFVESVNRDGTLNILGGNQGDAVNVRRFGRDRLIALRWPAGVAVANPAPWAGQAAQDTSGEA